MKRRRRRRLIGVSALASDRESIQEPVVVNRIPERSSSVELLLENLSKYENTRVSVSGDLVCSIME